MTAKSEEGSTRMMDESKGAAEWLRGIVDESYGNESRPLCTVIMKTFFGVECQEMHTCGSCILAVLTAIADRIDHEMMELPKDAEGEPIRIGDVLYSSGNECRVVSITVKADEACVGVHTDEGAFLPSVSPKYLSRKNTKPLESEVLDADGVPIEVGDTVYCDDCFEELFRWMWTDRCCSELGGDAHGN